MSSRTIKQSLLGFQRQSVIAQISNHVRSKGVARCLNTSGSAASLTASNNLPLETRRMLVPAPPSVFPKPLTVSDSVRALLPLLAVQPSHYLTVHIHGRPYLVQTGDMVRLPFRMPGVVPGDILRLNRAGSIGSRDYTLLGTPFVDERLYECRATVLGTEAEPMRFKEKTKRRNRKVKTVKSKHRFTILRIAELKIKSLSELGV